MSRRRSLEEHRRNLGDIREIMNSMKTLAYMETRKLSRFLAAQQAVVEAQRRAADDLLRFHPGLAPRAAGAGGALCLLVGSERGLCGDFNQSLLRYVDEDLPAAGKTPGALLCVGHKLGSLLADDARVVAVLEGASVVEEIPLQLPRLAQEIRRAQRELGLVELYAVVRRGAQAERHPLVPTFLRPAPERSAPRRAPGIAPLLNEPAATVLARLADQHLLALLQWLLYAALAEENHLRVVHLESAVRHLDEESADLVRRGNILRQEEIIEEIEVILLSAASIAANRAAMAAPQPPRGD